MKTLSWIIICLFLFLACKDQTNQPIYSYPKTILPSDTTQLWFTDGNLKADTILIDCQGGPKKRIGFEEHGRDLLRYLPDYKNYYTCYLHQAQTYNPQMFDYNTSFTKKMAATEINNTTKMLYQAIKYFKDRNKTVIVIGHSYGAFIIQHYLATKPSLANKYIISAGRIDVNPEMVAQHLKGVNGGFDSDGLTYLPSELKDASEYSTERKQERTVINLLKGVIGEYRFSTALADIDLSNVVYFYALNDQNVGALTPKEIEFLKSKRVPIFPTNDGHGDTFLRFIDAVEQGKLKL